TAQSAKTRRCIITVNTQRNRFRARLFAVNLSFLGPLLVSYSSPVRTLVSLCAGVLIAGCMGSAGQVREPTPPTPRQTFMGWATNGPSVLAVFTNPPLSGFFTNADGVVRRRPVSHIGSRT